MNGGGAAAPTQAMGVSAGASGAVGVPPAVMQGQVASVSATGAPGVAQCQVVAVHNLNAQDVVSRSAVVPQALPVAGQIQVAQEVGALVPAPNQRTL